MRLLQLLAEKDESAEFLNPVDYNGLGLDDYLEIVRTPMDLGTVRHRVRTGQYAALQDVLRDVKLIWEKADAMKKHTKRVCRKLGIRWKTRRGKNALGLREKVEFCERTKHVSYEVLSRCVRTVKEKCPSAAQTFTDEQITIKVDLLDRDTFNALVEILRDTEKSRPQ